MLALETIATKNAVLTKALLGQYMLTLNLHKLYFHNWVFVLLCFRVDALLIVRSLGSFLHFPGDPYSSRHAGSAGARNVLVF